MSFRTFGGGVYVLADLMSGTVHWLADRYGTSETPIFGPHFVVPFRNHHVFPKEITEHDFIETNGNNCVVSFWVLICAYFLIDVPYGDHVPIFWLGVTLFSMVAIMATNQLHKWAHTDHPPKAVQVLQRLHLILPPDHHDLHHTAPFDTHYCITTGWLNWPLQKLHAHEAAEWVSRLLGFPVTGGSTAFADWVTEQVAKGPPAAPAHRPVQAAPPE